jgi:hypothetical protein
LLSAQVSRSDVGWRGSPRDSKLKIASGVAQQHKAEIEISVHDTSLFLGASRKHLTELTTIEPSRN